MPIHRKKYNLTGTIPKEDHTLDILDEHVKLTVLNMHKELKENHGQRTKENLENYV